MDNSNLLRTIIRKIQLCGSYDDDVDKIVNESDTDGEEYAFKRGCDSELELSVKNYLKTSDNSNSSKVTHITHLKKNGKIIISWT